MKNKSGNKRGLHGNQGAKKKDEPRNKNINIRVNKSEKKIFSNAQIKSGLSQANFLMKLINK